MDALVNTNDILGVEKCHIKGVCHEVSYNQYMFNLEIECELKMMCSVSLEEVLVPVEFDTEVRFSYDIDDSSDDYPITKDTINLDDAVLSEIVLNIPLKVVKEGFEDQYSEYEEEEKINPSFQVLKELYGGEE